MRGDRAYRLGRRLGRLERRAQRAALQPRRPRAPWRARLSLDRAGDRVRLLLLRDPYSSLEPGDEGEVALVSLEGTVDVAWDSGVRLGLLPGVDRWLNLSQGGHQADVWPPPAPATTPPAWPPAPPAPPP